MELRDVVIMPIITEKSTKDAAFGRFTFKVAKKANKWVIRKAIEEKFKVNVLDVATSIIKGRKTRVGARRTEVSMPEWKKATVLLKKDQKIDLFETGGVK